MADDILFNEERAAAIMAKYGLDALIACTPENVTYSCGAHSRTTSVLRSLNMPYFVVWPQGGKGILILPRHELSFLVSQPYWVGEVRTYGDTHIMSPRKGVSLGGDEQRAFDLRMKAPHSPNGVEALRAVLKEQGLTKAKLGLDIRGISPHTLAIIRDLLPEAKIGDAYRMWREIRAVKTPAEVARLRQATRINEQALLEVIRFIEPGVTEESLWRSYKESVIKQDAFPIYWPSGAGTRSSWFFFPSSYKLKQNDLIRLDGLCMYELYCSDMGTTGVVGNKPDKLQAARHAALRAGVDEALRVIRPGVLASEVGQAVMRAVQTEGISAYKRPYCGHGLGLEPHELPIIWPTPRLEESWVWESGAEDMVLEENMVLNIEAPYYELGHGGYQLEVPVIVTKKGCEPLSHLGLEMFTK
jgi:Xaa-Pro aminopeptidase